MWIDRAVKRLLPREDRFFELLERSAGLALDIGALLDDCCTVPPDDRGALVGRIRELEHEADDVVAGVYEALNRIFVTPLDRSDIYQLATALEEIADDVLATALQLVVHAMEDLPPGSRDLAALIHRACGIVETAVQDLREMKDLSAIRQKCELLDRLGSEGDQIFRTQVAALFQSETDAIRLIKHKEFLEGLQHTLDACDDVGSALLTIVVKNA
jgi:uncharacterized protein Yka (UPF0111/DUF47 family)